MSAPSASSAAPGAALLEVRHLTVRLPTPSGLLTVLEDVSFDIANGEIVGLAGESGSGKSITALTIMRLLPLKGVQVDGSITFDGMDLLAAPKAAFRRVRGKDLTMVFQEPMSALHPAWRVGDQIAEVLRAHGSHRSAARAATLEMLERVGMPDPKRVASSYAYQLSGGMQQRAMLAMALVGRPKLLIADEPTTALDVTVQAQIVELLRSLQSELGMAVLFVSHDLSLLQVLCTRMIVMYAGQVIESADTASLLNRPRHPYTKALIDCSIEPSQKGSPLPSIAGHPPRFTALPRGCRFSARCPVVDTACLEVEPALIELGDGDGMGVVVRCLRHGPDALPDLARTAADGEDRRRG